MGVFEGFLDMMRLGTDDEDDDFYEDDYAAEEEPKASKRAAKKEETVTDKQPENITDIKKVREKPVAKVTPMRPNVKKSTNNGMEVCVIKPTSFEESREITETLLSGRTVVLNVEGLNVDIAQRIIDFTSGSCFAMSGNLQKISNFIFIITPANVDISGDFLELMENYDITGIY